MNTNFEYTKFFTENDLRKIYRKDKVAGPKKYLLLVVYLLLSSLLLVYPYTVGLGIFFIILGIGFAIFITKKDKKSLSELSSFDPYLNKEVTIGYNRDTVFFTSQDIRTEVKWSLLYSWVEKNNWVILNFSGSSQILFPVFELEKAKSYHDAIKLCGKYSKNENPKSSHGKYSDFQEYNTSSLFSIGFKKLKDSGNPNAFLVITGENSSLFLQFKYTSEAGFEIDFPVFTENQINFSQDLRDYANSIGLKETIRDVKGGYFIDYYLNSTPLEISEITKDIMENVFRNKKTDKYSIECTACVYNN